MKVAVTDLARSRAWYERVFDLRAKVEFADDDGVVRGVSYWPKGAFTLALRENATVARALAGFDPLAILVESRDDLETWALRLEGLGIPHSAVATGAVGWLFGFDDPDGIHLKLYTREEHTLTRKNRRRLPADGVAGVDDEPTN